VYANPPDVPPGKRAVFEIEIDYSPELASQELVAFWDY